MEEIKNKPMGLEQLMNGIFRYIGKKDLIFTKSIYSYEIKKLEKDFGYRTIIMGTEVACGDEFIIQSENTFSENILDLIRTLGIIHTVEDKDNESKTEINTIYIYPNALEKISKGDLSCFNFYENKLIQAVNEGYIDVEDANINIMDGRQAALRKYAPYALRNVKKGKGDSKTLGRDISIIKEAAAYRYIDPEKVNIAIIKGSSKKLKLDTEEILRRLDKYHDISKKNKIKFSEGDIDILVEARNKNFIKEDSYQFAVEIIRNTLQGHEQ